MIGTKVKACFAKIEKMISASGGDSLLPGELEPHTFKTKKFLGSLVIYKFHKMAQNYHFKELAQNDPKLTCFLFC